MPNQKGGSKISHIYLLIFKAAA